MAYTTPTQATQISATGTATTSVKAYTSNVSPASLLVACVTYAANTTCTFSDGVNSWTTIGPYFDATSGQAIAIGYAQNAASGATTVTATYGVTATFRTLQISEWAGGATSSVLDTNTGGRSNSTSTTPSDASMATAFDGELIIGACQGNVSVETAGAGFTVVQSDATNLFFSEYQVQTSAGSIACTYNASPTQSTATISAAFKAPSSAAGNTGSGAFPHMPGF